MKHGGVTDMHLRCRTQHQTLVTLAPHDADDWHRFAYLRYQHFPSIHVRFSWSRSMDRASSPSGAIRRDLSGDQRTVDTLWKAAVPHADLESLANMVAKYHIYIRLDIEMYNIQRDAITAGGESLVLIWQVDLVGITFWCSKIFMIFIPDFNRHEDSTNKKSDPSHGDWDGTVLLEIGQWLL